MSEGVKTDGLVCTQCGREAAPDAKGWRSYLGYDPREDEWPEAFVFCPECAERGFGPQS